jgi:hypothetical protein
MDEASEEFKHRQHGVACRVSWLMRIFRGRCQRRARREILMATDEPSVKALSGRVRWIAAGVELLLNRVKDTRSNVEFLMQVAKTTPSPGGRDDD